MRYRSYITILLLLFSAGILSAQTYSEKNTYMKSLPVNRDMTLEINNKYGTIHITTWSIDSVEIKAEVEAYASDHDRLDKMFREVNVNITGSSFLIRAETLFHIYHLISSLHGVMGVMWDLLSLTMSGILERDTISRAKGFAL